MPDGFGIDAQLTVIADADDDADVDADSDVADVDADDDADDDADVDVADVDADAGDRYCVVRGFPLAGSGADLMNLFGRNLRTKLN
jgi:hypothetical protein